MQKDAIIDLLNIQKGRLHRGDFFIFTFLLKFIGDILEKISPNFLVGTISFFFFAYFFFCLTAKRLRDINISGLYVLPVMVLYGAFVYFRYANTDLLSMGILSSELIYFQIYGIVVPFLTIILTLVIIPPQRRDNRFGSYVEKNIF